MEFKNVVVLVILLLTSSMLFSQFPGYKGKKVLITYEPEFRFKESPNKWIDYSVPTFNKYTDTASNRAYLTIKHGLRFDFVLSRRMSISFFGRYYRSALGEIDTTMLTLPIQNDRATFYDVGLGFSYFPYERNGTIAPVGTYYLLDLYGTRLFLDYFRDDVQSPDENPKRYLQLYPMAAIGLGQKIPLNDNLVFQWEIKWVETTFKRLESDEPELLAYQREEITKNLIQYTSKINFKLAFGFML